jgi:hypothetical protein
MVQIILCPGTRLFRKQSIPDNTGMELHVRTANTRDALLDAEFSYVVDGKDLSADIRFLSGQFLQFKIVLRSFVRSLSPFSQKRCSTHDCK